MSGVGDVKTGPATAASSMPLPTNPPCAGSCPEPPPDTSATFFCLRSLRTTILPASSFSSFSGRDFTRPWIISCSTFSTSLMIFFMMKNDLLQFVLEMKNRTCLIPLYLVYQSTRRNSSEIRTSMLEFSFLLFDFRKQWKLSESSFRLLSIKKPPQKWRNCGGFYLKMRHRTADA